MAGIEGNLGGVGEGSAVDQNRSPAEVYADVQSVVEAIGEQLGGGKVGYIPVDWEREDGSNKLVNASAVRGIAGEDHVTMGEDGTYSFVSRRFASDRIVDIVLSIAPSSAQGAVSIRRYGNGNGVRETTNSPTKVQKLATNTLYQMGRAIAMGQHPAGQSRAGAA